MKLICNGIEKETKYSNGWLDSHGKQWIYEDMETNHLMNVYKHIENNFKHYVGIDIGNYPKSVTTGYLDEAIAFTKAVRAEINKSSIHFEKDDYVQSIIEFYIYLFSDNIFIKKLLHKTTYINLCPT